MRTRAPLALFALVIAPLALACEDDDPDPARDADVGGAPDGGGVVAPDAGPPALTEPEIAGVAEAGTTEEIELATFVQGAATRADVRSHAARVISENTAARETLRELAESLDITPAESALSRRLPADRRSLQKKTAAVVGGPDTDMQLMHAMVRYHAHVLDVFQTVLIPSARTPSYREQILLTRDMLAFELAEARALYEDLGGPPVPVGE